MLRASRCGTAHDPYLKERAFGLSGPEGNHGEDAKDYWFYLDNLPSHAYMRALYKYPQRAFPYEQLRAENARRGRDDPEFELLDTGAFDEDRYFDVTRRIRQRLADATFSIRITVANRGPDAGDDRPVPDALVPQHLVVGATRLPSVARRRSPRTTAPSQILADHETLGRYHLTCDGRAGAAVHGERDERPSDCSARRIASAIRQGRVPRVRRATAVPTP